MLGEALVGPWGGGYPHCPLLGTQLSQPSSVAWLCPLNMGRGWMPEPGWAMVLETAWPSAQGGRTCKGKILNEWM